VGRNRTRAANDTTWVAHHAPSAGRHLCHLPQPAALSAIEVRHSTARAVGAAPVVVASSAARYHHRASRAIDYPFDYSRGAASDGRRTRPLPPTIAIASRPPVLTRIPPPQARPPQVGTQGPPTPLRATPIALWVAPALPTVAASLSLDTRRRCRRVSHRRLESTVLPPASPHPHAPLRAEKRPQCRAEGARPASEGPLRRPRVATTAATSPWLGRCRYISLQPVRAYRPP
jgi:hypothetical protein